MSVAAKAVPDDIYLSRFLGDWNYRRTAFRIANTICDQQIQEADDILALTSGDRILAELVSYLAASKRFVKTVTEAVRIGIVFTVWKEVERLSPLTKANPAGEDALRAKVAELTWLFEGSPISWTLYIVDDECPDGSLEVAQQIVTTDRLSSVVLLKLRDALPSAQPPLNRLTSPAASVKGGALICGLERAAADGNDYVLFTDCDNSNSLGQLGLFLEPVMSKGALVAIGDRRATGVSHWQDSRDSETTANYVLKRVRQLLDFDLVLRDVTCPFKLFERSALLSMLAKLDVFDFCVDYDMLAYVQKYAVPRIVVPIVSLDSELRTTWKPLGNASVWQQKLSGWVHVLSKYDLPHNQRVSNLIREYLYSLSNIEKVLQAGSHGVVLEGRQVTPEEQLKLSVEQIQLFLQSILSEPDRG